MRYSALFLFLVACSADADGPRTDDGSFMEDAQADAAATDANATCVEDHRCERCIDGFCVQRCPPPCPVGTDDCDAVLGDCEPCAFRSLQTAFDTMSVLGTLRVCDGTHVGGDVVFNGPVNPFIFFAVKPYDAAAGYTLSADGAERLLTVRSGILEIEGATLVGSTRHAIDVEPMGELVLFESKIRDVSGPGPGAGLHSVGRASVLDTEITNTTCLGEDAARGCAVFVEGGFLEVAGTEIYENTSALALVANAFGLVEDTTIANNVSDVGRADLVGSAIHVEASALTGLRLTVEGNGRSVDGPLRAADIASISGHLMLDELSLAGGRYRGTGDCELAGIRVTGMRPEHLESHGIGIHRTLSLASGSVDGCDTAIKQDITIDTLDVGLDISSMPDGVQVFRPELVELAAPYYCARNADCAAGPCTEDCPTGARCTASAECLANDCFSFDGVLNTCFQDE